MGNFQGDLTGFFRLGQRQLFYRRYFQPLNYPAETVWGYDGQFYLGVAQDPFLQSRYYRSLDNPSYRYSRIFLPLLAYLAAFGQKPLLPLTVTLVNFFFFFLSCYFFWRMVEKHRGPPFLIFIYVFLPCFVFGIFWMTPDTLAASLMMMALYFLNKNNFKTAVLIMIAAALTKETALILPLGACVYFLFKKDYRKIWWLTLPFVFYFGWSGWLFLKLRSWSFLGNTKSLGWAFDALNKKIFLFSKWRWSLQTVQKFVLPLFFLLAAAFSAIAVLQKRTVASITYFFAGILILTSASPIWENFLGYGRILSPVGILALVYSLENKKWWHLIPVVIFSLAAFLILGREFLIIFFPDLSF